MLVIGFGSENGIDYWLVQNSWGDQWGMSGFAKIKRGGNTCGIASCVSYPINIDDPEKLKVKRRFSRHDHDINATDAMCLDGSPSIIYFSKYYGDGLNKTVMFVDGGGWCESQTPDEVKSNCYNRTFTRWGSSNNEEWEDVYHDVNLWLIIQQNLTSV